MKKNLFIIIALMATSVSYAQSIRVYNWDFKNGSEAEVGKIFEQYFDRERNSGSAILQRVRFLDNVTHRVLLTGDPANWGSKEETSDVEWDAFLRGNVDASAIQSTGLVYSKIIGMERRRP